MANPYNPYIELMEKNPALCTQYDDLWAKILGYIKANKVVDEISLKTWFNDIFIVAISASAVAFFIPIKFQRDVLMERFSGEIENGVTAILGRELKLHFLEDGEAPFDIESEELAPEPQQPLIQTESDYEYTFDTFIVGNSNRFAHAAAVAVANNSTSSYNPLFIYGGSGLGKTHLLHAIMNHTRKLNPKANIVYLKGDDFTNELIAAIQKGNHVEFRSKYRYADLLLVDDIQFIAGKEMTQEEFFHTFNTLHEAKKQIVLTSDRPPKEIATLEERLRTRFEWGLHADISPPDFETRVAIIRRKASVLGIVLNNDIVEIIANNVKSNIRQLEGAVKKLKAFHVLTGSEINQTLAQNAIKDMFTEGSGKLLTPTLIVDEVSKFYKIKPYEILSKKRTSEIAVPRQVSMYIIRETMDMSLPAIGKFFGGRDHTTVIHSIKKTENEMLENPTFKHQINELIKNIKDN